MNLALTGTYCLLKPHQMSWWKGDCQEAVLKEGKQRLMYAKLHKK